MRERDDVTGNSLSKNRQLLKMLFADDKFKIFNTEKVAYRKMRIN